MAGGRQHSGEHLEKTGVSTQMSFGAAASEQALGARRDRQEGTGLKQLLPASLQVDTNSPAPARPQVL